MQTINLIDINDFSETIALRSALEYWGYKVDLDLIGNVNQLVELLSGQKPLSSIVVLMCHGNKTGLCLPELAPSVLQGMQFKENLKPDDIQSFCKADVDLIVNSGCMLGTQAYAEAFLAEGCQHYIGADDYPEGNDSLMFLLSFFYHLASNDIDIQTAYQKSLYVNDVLSMFKLYTKL